MVDVQRVSWQADVIATVLLGALFVSIGLVVTKRHHGHLTLDSTIGVQKSHAEPTPRVGGVGIYLGVLLAWLLVRDKGVREILGIILLAGLIPFACGLAEDVTKRVGVLPRLLATMAAGVAAWMLTGVCLNRLDMYGVDELMAWTPAAVLFTAFAVGGVANAINIIDGFHGLASGTSVIALVALGVIAAQVGDAQLALACFLVAAAIGGFWFVNYPWGKLFMGDGGAYFSGFALAWLAVLLPVRNPQVSVWAGLLVCAYPVIEVVYSIWRRTRHRQSPGSPDSDHLHSLIKVKLVRQRRAPDDVEKRMTNAAVSPFAWAFSSVPAITATQLFDRPVWLALGIVGCVGLYHAFYMYLSRREGDEHADTFEAPALRAYTHPHHHPRRVHRRARDRHSAVGR